jgi:hypothetical protein
MVWPRLLQDHRLRMLVAVAVAEVPVLLRQRAVQAAVARAVPAEYPVLQELLTVAVVAVGKVLLAAQTQEPQVVQAWLSFPHLLQQPQPQVRQQLPRPVVTQFISSIPPARLHSKETSWLILQK